MDIDDFDMEDATIVGGMMGFAEESMSNEEMSEDIDESLLNDLDMEKMPFNLRLYAKAHPDQFRHILKTVVKHSKSRRQEIMDKECMHLDPEPEGEY